jgi:serine/threonine-protein kinase
MTALVMNRYELRELMARGATAEVWRGHDLQLGRAVAVKLLHPHLLPDRLSRRRLAAEARAVAALSHPSIVRVYDVELAAERPAIVLELVEGGTLAQRLAAEGRLPAREAARIGAELAEALYHAHQRGIVHRDIKPANVLLDAAGRAKLADFGIARLLGEAAERMTMTGTVMGTLRYMAPEQLAGDRVGPRADLFSLAVVLYEALAGRPPFPGATPLGLAEEQARGAPPLSEADPRLAAIVEAGLVPRAADRTRHAGEMATALRAWLDGREMPLLLADRGRQPLVLGSRIGALPALPRTAAAALLVAALGGALGFTVLGGGGPGTAQPVAPVRAAEPKLPSVQSLKPRPTPTATPSPRKAKPSSGAPQRGGEHDD